MGPNERIPNPQNVVVEHHHHNRAAFVRMGFHECLRPFLQSSTIYKDFIPVLHFQHTPITFLQSQ